MNTGGDAERELGVARAQMLGMSDRLTPASGLADEMRRNQRDLGERLIGPLFLLLVAFALLALATGYATVFVGLCVLAAIAAFAWVMRRGARLVTIREKQLRALAKQKIQEKTNA